MPDPFATPVGYVKYRGPVESTIHDSIYLNDTTLSNPLIEALIARGKLLKRVHVLTSAPITDARSPSPVDIRSFTSALNATWSIPVILMPREEFEQQRAKETGATYPTLVLLNDELRLTNATAGEVKTTPAEDLITLPFISSPAAPGATRRGPGQAGPPTDPK